MQTSYTTDLTAAVAGMLADNGPQEIGSAPAAEAIPFGCAVVIKSDGTVELPKNTGALPATGAGSLVGVSIYKNHVPAGGYAAGDMVPFLRKGRIWARFTGTAATYNEAMQIRHASDNSNSELAHRGTFTDAAASTTVGQEKTAFSKGIARDGLTGLALMDLNLP
jgi:hypothetical protein